MANKKIHFAEKVNQNGGVSPLCSNEPYALNLQKETWTLKPANVTCKKCIERLKVSGKFEDKWDDVSPSTPEPK